MNAPTNTALTFWLADWQTERMPVDADWLALLRYLENRSAAKPVGEFFSPSQEALSLHADISLVFPATAATQFDGDLSGKGLRPPCITSPLFGLSGPLAALPFHYTEALLSARRGRNRVAADFFDIFNHRAQSLLYRALRKHRFVLDKERALAQAGDDRYSQLLTALCGYPEPQCVANEATLQVLPRAPWTNFAGLFAAKIRSAHNLEQLLRHYLQLDISIDQFTGRWVDIDDSSRVRLGARRNVHGSPVNQPLGAGILLGRRSWQVSAFFAITVRHPDAAQLAQLGAGQPMRIALWSLVRAFVGDEYDFHVEIITNHDVQCSARLHRSLHTTSHHTPDHASHHTLRARTMKDISATRLGWLGVLGTMSSAQTAIIKINHSTAARMQR